MNVLAAIADLGAFSIRFIDQLGRMATFAEHILATLPRRPIRFRLFRMEVYKLGVLSLVIISVCGLAVGMVLGLQGYHPLVRFGAEQALGAVVGLSLVRELGPVLTALLVTGRAGSATTAEIGTMVATEQLVGLRMMSVNPIDFVIGPKAVAMTFVMPLLSALFICMGLLGGYIVGLVSTFRGYNSDPTSAGVSRATTSTVVTASVAILISVYFITALWGV
jgi:phospholipid/cholesterol/gamma-HCH transport system permease protein